MNFKFFLTLIATTIIALVNLSTAMVLIPGDWNDIKLLMGFPISLTACLIFDHLVSQEYANYWLYLLAGGNKSFLEQIQEKLSTSPLGKIRYDEYMDLFQHLEAPLLKFSRTSLLHYFWIIVYLTVEFTISVYLLYQREIDLPFCLSIAPILSGLMNLGTGLIKGHFIAYPKALKNLRRKYAQYGGF